MVSRCGFAARSRSHSFRLQFAARERGRYQTKRMCARAKAVPATRLLVSMKYHGGILELIKHDGKEGDRSYRRCSLVLRVILTATDVCLAIPLSDCSGRMFEGASWLRGTRLRALSVGGGATIFM